MLSGTSALASLACNQLGCDLPWKERTERGRTVARETRTAVVVVSDSVAVGAAATVRARRTVEMVEMEKSIFEKRQI